MGIAADKLPHVFDRFYQVDDSSTRKAEGTGIGLQNIQNRYQLISQKDVDIIVTKDSFIVSLPLLKIENQSIVKINHIEK